MFLCPFLCFTVHISYYFTDVEKLFLTLQLMGESNLEWNMSLRYFISIHTDNIHKHEREA